MSHSHSCFKQNTLEKAPGNKNRGPFIKQVILLKFQVHIIYIDSVLRPPLVGGHATCITITVINTEVYELHTLQVMAYQFLQRSDRLQLSAVNTFSPAELHTTGNEKTIVILLPVKQEVSFAINLELLIERDCILRS